MLIRVYTTSVCVCVFVYLRSIAERSNYREAWSIDRSAGFSKDQRDENIVNK